MICSYRCYGVKKAFIQSYELMGVKTHERATETIIFEQSMCKYVRVNKITTFDRVYTSITITTFDHLLESGSCEWPTRFRLIHLLLKWFSLCTTGILRYFLPTTLPGISKYAQTDLEENIWMQLPIVFQVDGQTESDSDKQYLLKFNKNIYGLKQGNFKYYEKLKKLIVDRDFKPSAIYLC